MFWFVSSPPKINRSYTFVREKIQKFQAVADVDVKIQDPALADAKEFRSNWDHMCSVRVVRVVEIAVLKLGQLKLRDSGVRIAM